MGLKLVSIDYPDTPVHLGTSEDGAPHRFDEILVEPGSVRSNDPMMPTKKGGPFYAKLYQLDDGTPPSPASGPCYFGVGFRFGITDIATVNLFCHPSPGTPEAAMTDATYVGLRDNWSNLYRYVQYFGVQLAAGDANMVMVMPMFSNATWGSLGTLHKNWLEILNSILVEVQKTAWPDKTGQTMPRNEAPLKNVILSDFSAGRLVMNAARHLPGMGACLREIWDFDGAGTVPPLAPSPGQCIIYDQAVSGTGHNLFHVPLPRWIRFPFYLNDKGKKGGIHGEIPQRLFLHATTVSAYGH